MAATMGGDVDADLTALESRVKGLRNRLRAMLLSETASLQARSCFNTEHSSSSNSFAHPDLSYSDDASDDKPPPYPSVAPSLDSQPHSRPVLTPIPPESPVTPLCAHTPDRETAPVGPRPPLSTSAAPPPPPPPPPPMSPYRAHPPPPPPTPPLVNLSARSQPAEPGVAQSRIESKLDALYMALTSALSNMQSTQPSLADVHIPEYTPLSKEPPPEHMADIVDAREALLAELKEKLAARRGDE